MTEAPDDPASRAPSARGEVAEGAAADARLGTIGHDIRNRAAAIRNAVHLLRRRHGLASEAASLVDMIDAQVDGLLSDYERMSRGEDVAAAERGSAARDEGAGGAAGSRTNETRGEARSGSKARRVLIADDSSALRESLASALDAMGFDVRTVGDGAEAVEVAAQWRPDFMLVDQRMPKMSGIEVARALRARFSSREITLILMSGNDLDEALESAARRAGFDYCVDKGRPLDDLTAILRS